MTRKTYIQINKGNIVLSLIVALLVMTSITTIALSFIKDSNASKISYKRVSQETEMNTFVIVAENTIFSYLNSKENPITYMQYTEEIEGTNKKNIRRLAMNDPLLMDVQSLKPYEYKGKPLTLIQESEQLGFAGYRFNVKVLLDYDYNSIKTDLRIQNIAINNTQGFWEDNNLSQNIAGFKNNIKLKDIPFIVIVEYNNHIQEMHFVISGLRYTRDIFPIIYQSSTDTPVDSKYTSFDQATVGSAQAYILTDYAICKLVEVTRGTENVF